MGLSEGFVMLAMQRPYGRKLDPTNWLPEFIEFLKTTKFQEGMFTKQNCHILYGSKGDLFVWGGAFNGYTAEQYQGLVKAISRHFTTEVYLIFHPDFGDFVPRCFRFHDGEERFDIEIGLEKGITK